MFLETCVQFVHCVDQYNLDGISDHSADSVEAIGNIVEIGEAHCGIAAVQAVAFSSIVGCWNMEVANEAETTTRK